MCTGDVLVTRALRDSEFTAFKHQKHEDTPMELLGMLTLKATQKALLSLLALSFTVLADTASASWQYTKWGMSPEQVRGASGGKASETTSEERVGKGSSGSNGTDGPSLVAPYSSGKYVFDAFFYFDAANRLSKVTLELRDPSLGAELLGSLRGKYGKPMDESENQYTHFAVWHKDGDLIGYLAVVSESYSITYKPLVTKDNEGL